MSCGSLQIQDHRLVPKRDLISHIVKKLQKSNVLINIYNGNNILGTFRTVYRRVTRSSLISNKLKRYLFKNDGTELRHRIF